MQLFRVWDKKESRMLSDFSVSASGYIIIDQQMKGGHIEQMTFAPDNRFVLMAHIGLNDKHGTPIFDGDIVRRRRPCLKSNGTKNGSVIDEIQVRFIQDGRRNGFNLVSAAYCEVIGHIWST